MFLFGGVTVRRVVVVGGWRTEGQRLAVQLAFHTRLVKLAFQETWVRVGSHELENLEEKAQCNGKPGRGHIIEGSNHSHLFLGAVVEGW